MAKIDDSVKKKVPELRFPGFTDDWEERKLGDLGSVAMNKRIFKEQTSDVGDIPFYKIGTFGGTPDAFISRDIFEEYKSKYQYPEVGDILISASGSIGRTVVYQGYDEYFQDSNIVWLKHDQQLDNSFLKQFYSIVKWQGLEGSTIKRLYNKNILETKITLPSPEEQAQLGSFFKQLDNTIALHQRKLDLLKEQKKGYLQKMFPKNGAKVPELRFAGFADAWEQRKLGDITTWTKGQGLSKEYLNNERYGSEAVHYADLYKFSPVMQEVIHWTNSDDGRIIPDNSLLFPASDVTPVGLARTSTLRLSGVKAGGDVIIGQLSERINSSFMSYQINANSKKILPLITGTTVRHVQAKSLATMSVTITNMAEQTAIAGLFERIDNLIALHQRKLDLLKEQKKGFLQKMFV